MKKLTAFIMLAALLFSLVSSVAADEYNEYMELRLGLIYGRDDVDEIRLTSKGGFNICYGENNNYYYRFSMLEEELIITKCGEEDYYINGNYYIALGGEVAVKPAYGVIGVNGDDYRGFISLKRIKGSDITVINVVGLEEYLFSVVGREMSPSWPIEALKAQAVCARTYAKTNLNKFKHYGFDLDTTQNSQVYVGVKGESESTIRACSETAGESVRYEGKPVPVYYFSSSGGVTENPENVWGGSLPYIVSVEDIYENENEATRYKWTNTITVGELKEKLAAAGNDIGDILSIDVIKRAESGRVTEMAIRGTMGIRSAELDRVRRLLGTDIVYSQQFEIFYQMPENPEEMLSFDPENEEPLPDEAIIIINGRGWGHAVGMSQWGAKAMAEAGKTYKEILCFYFSGVEIY